MVIMFDNYHPDIREQTKQQFSGHLAIRFPVGYSLKHGKGWANLSRVDAEGYIVKTHGCETLVLEFAKKLENYQVHFELFTI